MLRLFSALIPAHRRVALAVRHLVETRDGQPLLDLIRHGHVRWVTLGSCANSMDGYLYVENDRYFYLTVRYGLSSYSVSSSLTTLTMASKLECAAVNASRIANAVDCYTPGSPDYRPEPGEAPSDAKPAAPAQRNPYPAVQPCDRCGAPVPVNAVSPSECFCSQECCDAAYDADGERCAGDR